MADQIESARPMAQQATIAKGTQALGERRLRDLRTLRRIAIVISIVLAPLAVGVVRATVPLASSSGGKGAIAAVAANPAMARVELAAGVVASLLLPFAIVGLTRLVVRLAPVLALLGGSLALVGWALVPALVTSDAVTYEMARSGANSAQLAALWEQLNGNFAVNMLFTVFIVFDQKKERAYVTVLHRINDTSDLKRGGSKQRRGATAWAPPAPLAGALARARAD
jgi:hypothetical protein